MRGVQTVNWLAFLGRAYAGGVQTEDAIPITGCEVLDPALPLDSSHSRQANLSEFLSLSTERIMI